MQGAHDSKAASVHDRHKPDLGTRGLFDNGGIMRKKRNKKNGQRPPSQQYGGGRVEKPRKGSSFNVAAADGGGGGAAAQGQGTRVPEAGAGESAVAGWPHVNRGTRCTRRGGCTRWATAQVRRWHLRR